MGFQRATKNRHCQLCQGDHACSVTDDGLHLCKRRHHGDYVPGYRYLGESKNGTWGLYRAEGDDRGRSSGNHARAVPPSPADDAKEAAREKAKAEKAERAYRKRVADWEEVFPRWIESARKCRQDKLLAEKLGVPLWAVRLFEVGYLVDYDGNAPELCRWVSPERSADGQIIGVATRDCETGEKKTLQGSRRGLTFPIDPNATTQPTGHTFHPEGLSDCIALTAMKLESVSRPSNTGGAEDLSDWFKLRPHADNLTPVVIGERDGRWRLNPKTGASEWIQPGIDGGRKVAQEMANLLERPVLMCLPPEGSKDTRAWFTQQVQARGIDTNDRATLAALGREYLGLLLASAESYEPGGIVPAPLTAAEEKMMERVWKVCQDYDAAEELAKAVIAAVPAPLPKEPALYVPPVKTGPMQYTFDLTHDTWESLEDGPDDRIVEGERARWCGDVFEFRHLHDNRIANFSLKCKQWRCGVCIDCLKKVWTDHLTATLGACEKVYCWYGPKEAWAAIRKSITENGRAEGLWEPHGTQERTNKKTGEVKVVELGSVGYVRYSHGGANIFVMAEVPFEVPKKHGGSEVTCLTGGVGAALMRQIIAAIPQCLKRPLSTSRKWRLPVVVKPRKWCRTQRIGNRTLMATQQIYRQWGIETRTWDWGEKNPQPWAINWVAEIVNVAAFDRLSEVDRQALYCQLRGGSPPLSQTG